MMTRTQTIEQVEQQAEKLGIKDPFGERLTGIEALGVVARKYPHLEKIQDEFFLNGADPLWYFFEATKLIHFFKEDHRLRKIEKPSMEEKSHE